MTDNKKYIVNVGDQSEMWDSDMLAEKGDALYAKYKDAEVFEVEDVEDFDEDPTDHQYVVNVGDESEIWDADMVKQKGSKLKEAYPDAMIQRVSYQDYWGDRAKANREQRALLAQPDQERNARLADLGYYDDITGEAFSYTQSEEGVPQWGPSLGLQPLSSIVGENEDGTTSYADPKVAEFFANDTSYTDRQAEIARLDAEYESNPSVIAQREYEAQWRADQAKYNDTLEAQIRKDAEADGVGDAQRRQNRKIAPMLGMGNPMLVAQYNAMYADAELPTKQSENYASALNMMEKIKELQKVSEKGFGGATLDVAKEKFESWREPDIALYNRVGDILTNLEAEFKDKGLTPENLTPEVLEQHLSNDEKALILAFFQYNSALEDAQQDMSAWYKGGKIFAESVPFMLEFLATGGLYKAAGSAATKGMAGALKKWVLGAAKGSVKRTLRKGAAVALRDLVYAGVGTLARTVISPGTYNRMAEESVKIEDGHLDRTKNVFKSFADSYIENLSEISGGLIGKGLGLLGKGIGKAASMSGIPFSKLGSMLADNKLMQTIAAGWKSVAPKFEALGFHGLFEEIGEEYIGNAIREFTIQPGALAEMHKDNNFGAMLIGFAPMTLFGGAMSAVSIGAKNIEAANLGKELRETLGQHYSEEQIDHMMNLVSGAENADAVWEAIKPLTVGLNAEETQQLFQYGAFMAQNKAMLFAKKAQDDNLAQAKRAELQQTYNKFWQENAEGVESVQLASLNDGRTVFVVSEPTADGVVSIIDASTGAKGFTNISNYKTEEVDGAAVPMTRTWSMDAYLEGEIASERRTAEGARMEREYNEQVKSLQSQIKEGTRINLGTEGNPVIMLATGQFSKEGVTAVDQAGNTHTIGWNQVADAMQQPISVKTDQQIIDEEIAAVVARNADRRKRMSDATPAITKAVNESAAQTAEVVAQESKHIPMNEDGSVNEAAFWEQDPEGYVQWNDEQNQDGGADSLQQIGVTKAVLSSLLAEAQKAQQTSNPAERKAAKQRAQQITEKIDRLSAIEANYAEQKISPLRERAMRWKELTNAPVYIVETEEDLASISGQAAESSRGGMRVRGFAKDGRAYIYLPGIIEASEIDAVFMHEAVAHAGLKGMLGQQAFDQLCDQVWEMMSPEARQVFIDYPGVNGDKRAAADEYIAHIAERMGSGVATAEEKTIWQKIIDFVRNALRSMGITLNVSESELSDLIHMAYADLAKNMAEAEDIAVQQQEARVAEREAPSAARQEYDTYAEDLTHDEIKAVAANDLNAAQEAYDALVASAPKVEMGESAKDFIARKKAYNEQLAEAKAALDARQALMDEIARIDAANAPVLTDAEVLEREGLGVDTQNDDVRMSVRYAPTEKQREMIIGSVMNVTGRTREEAERWLASETSLAAMINEDLQYLDYVADPKYKAIKDNSDYPQGTVDFNNICRKRLPFTRMFTRLQRRFPNRVFTAEELADIRTIMSKDDLMVACGLCYVEDRRQMVGEVAQSFIDGLQEKFKTYANNPTKKKNAKKFNELIAGDTYVPQVYDLTTQEGLDKLYNEHRGIWEAFQAFNNARGQQSQNLLQGYAEYKREILSWSDKKVKSVNDNGGLRIFSYSDFEAHHLIDVVQIIIDCAAKGVKIQGYTKVPEFARAVANTGIKLNRSLIPLGDTGLVDGQLAFDPVEGIDINDPNFLESNDNVGNILIGINDEQIRIAMADPRIHYIIPYHARQKENIRQKLNVGAWTNYISTQNERNISDGKRVKDNINIYTDILTGDVTTDRQFVEKYLQLCKEKGRIPKFDQFLEKDAEGNYLYTPGYYKFLVDFKLFDENGNILPQQPVVAEFDDAFNMQILENYAKDERESTGEQMNETYDKIVDALGLDESAAEGSDVRFSTVKEIADKFNAELQQQIDGTLPNGHVYQLGVPGAVLASTGIPNLPITLQASVLNVKANDPLHPFALEEIRDLVPAIQRPWAIFKYGDSGKAQNLIVGIAKEDKQFLVGLSLNPTVKGKTLYINSVRNVFPKDNDEWLNWIQQGKLLRVDEKEKIQAIIDALRINPVDYTHLDLDSIANIVKEFVNPSITAENEDTHLSVRTDEQREKLFADAKAQFGLTNNFKVAGYMLPDGTLLDFSEANDGGDPNQRTLDHREIEGIIMDEGKEYDSRWMYLADFMNEGAIRLLPEYAGINLMKAPTKEQRSRLFDFIYKYNGEVILEIADERLNNVAYVEYDRRTSPSRIFRDIDGYFNEGIVPQQDVRFSVFEPHNATIDEIDGLFRDYNMDESLTPLYDKVSALAHSMDLKIRFDYPWSAAAGSTFGDKVKFNTEFFNSLAYKSQDKAHALLHEMIHATTNYAIAARNTDALTEGMKEAVSQLEGIYGEIVNDSAFDGTYGARSVYEMVAELSNPEFRSLLKEKNLFQRIVDAIKRLLGIEVGENALDNLSATLDYMLDNYDGRVFGAVVNQYQKHQEYTRFSVVNENQAIFVSNAARAVEGIKMEKATPAQWLAMIEKNGGLKAGEDKWMGLSDWLKESDRKTLTKAEVLEFVNEHAIKIEETHYDAYAEEKVADAYGEMERILQDKFNAYRQEYYEQNEDEDLYGNPANDYAIERLREEFGDEFPYAIEVTGAGDVYLTFPYEEDEDMRKWSDKLGVEYNPMMPIEGTRLNYTTDGLTNKREIALTVPTIEPWGEEDMTHFGDAGEGRAVAWIRFGETEITEEGSHMGYEPKNDVEREIKDYIEMGMNRWGYPFEECVGYAYNQITDAPQESVGWTEEAVTAVADGMRGKKKARKILVIDEIQSKRHQEGREQGYITEAQIAEGRARHESLRVAAKEANAKLYDFIGTLVEKYPNTEYSVESARGNIGRFTVEDRLKFSELVDAERDSEYELRHYKAPTGIPDAPFEKNWHELAMKRMLRYAAEEGYDAIAWTKGEQQAERYNIGSYVSSIEMQEEYDGNRDFGFYMGDSDEALTVTVDENGTVVSAEGHLSQAEGRPLADLVGKDMAVKMMQMEEYDVLEDTDLKVGNEGMKGFYDKMLPAFMNKYGKKWGVKVEDIELPNLENGLTMHSVPVTEEMKASVMEGQVMFSAVQIDPAVRQEMDTIKAKAMWNGTFMKAPNGADTKLTEDQWLMVRTKNFINWFGDWINDPESASKVVDPETREPRVMYHGSAWHPLTEPKGNAVFRMRTGLLGRGAYFASSIEEATLYAEMATDLDVAIEGNYEILQDEYVTDYFLNIRNTEDIRDFGREDIIAVAKSPSQIKSATDTTGEFSESGDIRYSSRFDVDPNPTEAQKKAGNYKMGHLRLDGYNITIENPKGSVRRGTDSNGNEWENVLNNDYGYIRGTEGVDGDHIDVYLSENPEEGNVFVVDQVRPDTGEFDEHKVMYGFGSIDEAREAYLANFSEGWNGLGTITEVTKDEFRKWIDSSHRKTKPFSEYKSVKTDILEEGNIRYSLVTDPAILDRLENEPTIKVYRAMQQIDGKLYPPMSAKVDGKMREPIELGKWEQADERPDLADEKGYFKLDKGNKTSLKARYNPYFHTSPTPLNDQFASAQTRPELVTVEVEVPESELTSGYKAEKAKDSVGQMEWKAGVVQSKLSGTRTVILSRWDKPVRIVPDSEVADRIVEMFEGKDITMPSNVVTPSLRAELEKRGIPFMETNNQGKQVETDIQYSALSTPTDQVVSEGMRLSIQEFARLAGNIFEALPEAARKEAIEETFKRGWDMQSAIFQIPARLAEKESWDESDRKLAQIIRDKVQDALEENGGVMSRPLTSKEALWMLYRSTEAKSDSMLDMARRSLVARNLGFGAATRKQEKEDIRFSAHGDRSVDDLVETGRQKAQDAKSDFMDTILAINGKLDDLRKAASAQRKYDEQTVKIIASLANELLEKGALSDLTRGEVKRLISVLKDSVGKRDLTVSFDRLMDILIANQLRFSRERFEQLLKIKASKVDARGVEVKGKLDVSGQRVVRALKDGIGLDVDTLTDRISDCENKLTSESEVVRANAEVDLMGYKLALNYMIEIKASQIEEKNLRKSLEDAKEDYDAGNMTEDAYREFKKSAYNAIRENRMERVKAYDKFLSKLTGIVKSSIIRADKMMEAEKQRVERIQHFANSDMQGMPAAEHERKESIFWNNPVTRFLLKPFATFDQMLRSFAPKSRNGEGYLWNHFMGGWLKATEKEYKGIQAAHEILDAKAREVFGPSVKRWSDIFILERSMRKAEVTFWDDGDFRTYEIPQGNLLYIYMVNKMSDGRMKLRRMGITETNVFDIMRALDPRFIEIADWIQDEFLPSLREKYNAVHERLFGAPMAAIDNYFPLKVNANSRTREIDLGIGDMEGKPSTITGSIIKRTKNALALDLLHSDAFDVVLGHIEEMEHWAAFAEWNQDLNSLLSYRKFRNRVQNTSGIYGTGTTAWNSFKATAEIAAGVYKPATKADSLDKHIMNIAKGVTGSKIAFRVYTAFKQLLSWPAFLADANWAILAKNFATPAKAWNWCMENLPLFEKRWKSRQAGDSRLMETDADWKIWKNRVVEIAGRLGMTPNAFIDALTVAIGSRSVYETKVNEYLKYGYSQEEAEEKAKRDATISFNESQQSNESAFLSQVQIDRTVASVVFTVFRNSSMGYQRQYVDAIRNIVHMMKPGYKESSIAYMRKQMIRDGLADEQADRAANKIFNRSFTRNALKALTFGFVVQFAWNLGPSLVYMLLGDDDEEKRNAAKDAAVRALIGGPIEGMASGNVISNILGNVAMGEELSTISGAQLPAVSDLENIVTLWENDKVRAANEVFNLFVSSGLGFSPQTMTDAVTAIIDATNGDLGLSTEITLALLRILQVPQSQTEKLYMDEIDMKADDAFDLTVEEFAERYARYKLRKSAGPFASFYSDEKEKERINKLIKQFTSKAEEARRTRGSEVAKEFFEYYDNEYEETRKTISEMRKEIEHFSINGLIEEAEQTMARLEGFMQSEEFEKYAELAPYIKMYEGYKDLLKKVDNPETKMEYAQEMTKVMNEMVKIMEGLE